MIELEPLDERGIRDDAHQKFEERSNPISIVDHLWTFYDINDCCLQSQLHPDQDRGRLVDQANASQTEWSIQW
ncbi:unnamed protein product [Echinostoma caproni]|uniref:Uncharacterized protein n=1 Tax=Echinostoma caproni TaxID=27848 RepID=A0A183BC90_9TREM|nr:unnamed protein product [Echinostoma caproni]